MDVNATGQVPTQSPPQRRYTRPILGILAVIGVICLFAGASVARDRSGGIGTLPGLGTLEGQQSIVIHDSRGGTTVGTYNRDSGSLFLSGPQNQLTIGQQDSAGNIVIQEYGGDDDG